MLKLMIWAVRCGQFTPKVLAISCTGPPPPACAIMTMTFIVAPPHAPGAPPGGRADRSPHEEQGVEHDRFGEGDSQNRLDQDRRRRTGIASGRIGRLHADHANGECGAKGRESDM